MSFRSGAPAADLSWSRDPAGRTRHANQGGGIDPDDLALCLRVLAQAEALPPEHPDAVAVRRATAKIFKSVKNARRARAPGRDQRRRQGRGGGHRHRLAGPHRRRDRGHPAGVQRRRALAGIFVRPRPCYICKTGLRRRSTRSTTSSARAAPPSTAATGTPAPTCTGRRALLTGGRAKIGMYIALRLLRDGAHTTITTRFPGDAVRRFTAMPDSADWLHRLRIVGIDLRDPAQVVALADSVAEAGPLDILINNAAQTVRRSPGAYAPLAAAESDPLPDGPLPELLTFDHISDAHPHALAGSLSEHPLPHLPDGLRRRASSPGSRCSPARRPPSWSQAGRAIDAGGLVPDLHRVNSWTQRVNEVDPLELLEVQLCNMTAPFILVSRLRAALAASPARRKYIVNVSAMEGVFGRGYKGPGSPAHQHGQGGAEHADQDQRHRRCSPTAS